MRSLLLGILLLTSACSHVHSYNQDSMLDAPGVEISETREKTVWFNFNSDNGFIDEARAAFFAKCPGGVVHSVSSRLSSENGVFSWRSRVHFQGICSDAGPGQPKLATR